MPVYGVSPISGYAIGSINFENVVDTEEFRGSEWSVEELIGIFSLRIESSTLYSSPTITMYRGLLREFKVVVTYFRTRTLYQSQTA